MSTLPIDPDGAIHCLVDHLGYDLDPSILIGGWATFEMVGGEISRDIDLIIMSDEVRAKIQKRVDDLSSSTHLQGGEKWRGVVDGIHVDIYLPHQSQLGSVLRLRVEELAKYTEPGLHKGWRLLTIEAHTVTKMAALLDRPDTEKGKKDSGELLRLLRKGVDPVVACSILVASTAGDDRAVPELVDRSFRFISERIPRSKDDRKFLDGLRRIWVDAAKAAVDPNGGAHFRPQLD